MSALTEFPLPSAGSAAFALTAGPDGNLWFPESGKIGRITPAGTITEFPLPSAGTAAFALTAGPDGNLWFPESGGKIGRITPAGTITEFSHPRSDSNPSALTVGPDGSLWFSEWSGRVTWPNQIARITTAGTVTEFPDIHIFVDEVLTAGPDGNLWFTEWGGKIGRITPAGTITEFSLPRSDSEPSALTVGPDGSLWFSERFTGEGYRRTPPDRIGRITLAGAVTEFSLPKPPEFGPANSRGAVYPPGILGGLTLGPDDNLWFSVGYWSLDEKAGIADVRFDRITPKGVVTEFSLPTSFVHPSVLTFGPDGNLWFSDQGTFWQPPRPVIGRIDPSALRDTGVVYLAESRKGITSIILSFDMALIPDMAKKRRFYHVVSVVQRGERPVFGRRMKIARVLYDRTEHRVTLKLARPLRGMVQVTVRNRILVADGVSSFSDFTELVQ